MLLLVKGTHSDTSVSGLKLLVTDEATPSVSDEDLELKYLYLCTSKASKLSTFDPHHPHVLRQERRADVHLGALTV